MRFSGRTAFITGGAIGFGRGFADALAAEGATVAIVDIDRDAAERAAAEIVTAGHSAIAVICDVSDEEAVDAAVAQVVDLTGGIDILINNAGLHLMKYNQPFSVLSRADVRALFDVNVIGVVNCTVACRETMAARGGGVVVNIASMASNMSISPYGVSKLAVRGLTIAFAQELSPDRIRVNAISPGLIATESAMADLPQEMIDMLVNERQLVHRLGQVSDIVSMMTYLCSDDASFITGETFRVSGGMPLSI